MKENKKAPEKELSHDEQVSKNLKEWKIEKREKSLVFLNVVVLMIVFIGIAAFMTFGERPNVSYAENRDLEKPPEFTWEGYWSGYVTEQLGKYYNDTVPMRSTWKLFIAEFRSHLGIKYDNGVTIVGDLPVIEKPTDTNSNTSKPNNNIPDVVIPGQSNTSAPYDKVPSVVIPGESNASTPYDKVPGVVIPEESSASAPYDKIPSVVIPNQSAAD